MRETLPNQLILQNPQERCKAATGLINDIASENPQIRYVAGFGSFWNGGRNPNDIDLIVAVTSKIEFPDPNLVFQPLQSLFGIPADLQLADIWEVEIRNNVRNLKNMLKKGRDLYGSKPDWLK